MRRGQCAPLHESGGWAELRITPAERGTSMARQKVWPVALLILGPALGCQGSIVGENAGGKRPGPGGSSVTPDEPDSTPVDPTKPAAPPQPPAPAPAQADPRGHGGAAHAGRSARRRACSAAAAHAARVQ